MANSFSGGRARAWCGFALVLLAGLLVGARPYPPAPTQAQVARRFLGEVLRADYPTAYRRLAPEVRAGVPLAAFGAAARPLWQQGQARGPAIELYQVGVRLGTGRTGSRWFCRFTFASDSAHRPPPVLLEVTFRDTTARAVLGFGLRRRGGG
ncbi:hypothetical protein E4631_00500 [Hymenobacter sp. UV11]|uniref:hypothetical protein n=1 Tax=Hymenobacter sp. UV11 TaxID=1849735 RepID=UPI00105B2791|nr:hypothetical protein [Hymenobacter sp. UV11]TDN37399.1 hypothetical protein A8B98_02330 [Hymenobacter sp. UV11]TFZ68586.1 hypothetical protein E4631_00500 [Hymenobacter sp. UV11]